MQDQEPHEAKIKILVETMYFDGTNKAQVIDFAGGVIKEGGNGLLFTNKIGQVFNISENTYILKRGDKMLFLSKEKFTEFMNIFNYLFHG